MKVWIFFMLWLCRWAYDMDILYVEYDGMDIIRDEYNIWYYEFKFGCGCSCICSCWYKYGYFIYLFIYTKYSKSYPIYKDI